MEPVALEKHDVLYIGETFNEWVFNDIAFFELSALPLLPLFTNGFGRAPVFCRNVTSVFRLFKPNI